MAVGLQAWKKLIKENSFALSGVARLLLLLWHLHMRREPGKEEETERNKKDDVFAARSPHQND